MQRGNKIFYIAIANLYFCDKRKTFIFAFKLVHNYACMIDFCNDTATTYKAVYCTTLKLDLGVWNSTDDIVMFCDCSRQAARRWGRDEGTWGLGIVMMHCRQPESSVIVFHRCSHLPVFHCPDLLQVVRYIVSTFCVHRGYCHKVLEVLKGSQSLYIVRVYDDMKCMSELVTSSNWT